MILAATLTGLCIGYLVLILLYHSSWKSMPYYHTDSIEPNKETVAVIVPARNEEENLQHLLPSLIAQKGLTIRPEIVVINDSSTDNTAEIAAKFRPRIQLINLADFLSGAIIAYKKKAIETGISQTKGDIILTTDADCIVPENWVKTAADFISKKNLSFVAMPVRMQPGRSFSGIFQSLDFMSLQAVTAAAVHRKWHFLCNGANLGYRRKAFEEVHGFENINNIASGDDMLLMEKIAMQNPDAVDYLFSRDVIVDTGPEKNWTRFIHQRIRWAGKFRFFKNKVTLTVMLWMYLFNLILVLAPIIACFSEHNKGFILRLWVTVIIAKTLAEWLFLIPVARFFQQTSLLKWFPLMQPFHIIYTVLTGVLTFIVRKPTWKGREIK